MKYPVLLIILVQSLFAFSLEDNLKNINTIDFYRKVNVKNSITNQQSIIDYHNRFSIKSNYISIYGNLGVVKYQNNPVIRIKKLHSTLYFDYLYFKLSLSKDVKLATGIISMLGGNIEKYRNYDIPRGNGLGVLGKFNSLGTMIIIKKGHSKYKAGLGEYFGKDYSGSHYFLKEFKGSKGLFLIYEYSKEKQNIELNYFKYSVNFSTFGIKKEPLNLYGIGYRFDNTISSNYVIYTAAGYSDFMNKNGYIYKLGYKVYFDTTLLEYNLGIEYIKISKNFYNLDNTIFKFGMINNHGESSTYTIYSDFIYKNKFYFTPMYSRIDAEVMKGIVNIYSLQIRYAF